MTLDLEALAVRRAEEQIANGITIPARYERERDPERIVGPRPRQPRAKRTRPCLAGDCSGRVKAFGYCHKHAQQIRGGVALDRDVRSERRA